jgi:hypothetical protein
MRSAGQTLEHANRILPVHRFTEDAPIHNHGGIGAQNCRRNSVTPAYFERLFPGYPANIFPSALSCPDGFIDSRNNHLVCHTNLVQQFPPPWG